MGLPAPSISPQSPQGSKIIRLKKSELLFSEGDGSRAMYLLKKGIVRLFKKKGDSDIELDTIHSGQILGELAFLDGNPRSASGEALVDCELLEISSPQFIQVITQTPDWLKILLKTIVGRLRTASTRIRQLEAASTTFEYNSKDGKRSAQYVYLSPIEVLKIASSILLVASRNGTDAGAGIEVRVGLIQRYSNQIMGVPVAKVTTFLDVLNVLEILTVTDENYASKVFLKDIDFLENSIAYLNEENLLEPSKRHDLTPRSFQIMALIVKYVGLFKKDEATGLTEVNLVEIKNAESEVEGKESFRMEDTAELVKLGYLSRINIKSSDEILTSVQEDSFRIAYRLQQLVMAIREINEQKSRA